MTLNGVMAVILRYFSEFGYLSGVLRKRSRSLSHILRCISPEAKNKKLLLLLLLLLFVVVVVTNAGIIVTLTLKRFRGTLQSKSGHYCTIPQCQVCVFSKIQKKTPIRLALNASHCTPSVILPLTKTGTAQKEKNWNRNGVESMRYGR